MTSKTAMAKASVNNVVVLQTRQAKTHENARQDLVQDDFSVSRRRPLEKDVDVGSKLENRSSVLEYTGENYPYEYSSWRNMKQRCRKGIGVLHPEFEKFSDFMTHMEPKPSQEYTLDRIDYKNPEYSPKNCRWASKTLQTRNRSNTRMLTDNTGTSLPIAEWSTRTGVPAKTIAKRIDRGKWSVHEAIHRPVGYQYKRNQAALLPSTSCDELVNLWEQRLSEVHKQRFISTQPKNRKQLNEISRFLKQDGVQALPALALVLDNWPAFTNYADRRYGAFNPPEVPTTEYLRRAISAIGNFYLERSARVKTEPGSDRPHQAALSEVQLSSEKEALKEEFISQFLLSDPLYELLQHRIDHLNQYKDDPQSGLSPEEYDHFFLLWIQPTPSGKTEQELIWGALENADKAWENPNSEWHRQVWDQNLIDAEHEKQTFLRESGILNAAQKAWTEYELSAEQSKLH